MFELIASRFKLIISQWDYSVCTIFWLFMSVDHDQRLCVLHLNHMGANPCLLLQRTPPTIQT